MWPSSSMFFQCTADLPNYLELYKITLEIFEDEKCGLVGDVCQLAKRSGAHEVGKAKKLVYLRNTLRNYFRNYFSIFTMRLLHSERNPVK